MFRKGPASVSHTSDAGQVDEGIQEFLRARIESFEQLETLFLLQKHRDRVWSPHQVSEELKIDGDEARRALQHLNRTKLLDLRKEGEADSFIYGPESLSLSETVDRLLAAYDDARLKIVRLVGKNALERIRTNALRVFADSFVLGRKRK